jgi:hypothetical protein
MTMHDNIILFSGTASAKLAAAMAQLLGQLPGAGSVETRNVWTAPATSVVKVVGDVRDRPCLIIDDMNSPGRGHWRFRSEESIRDLFAQVIHSGGAANHFGTGSGKAGSNLSGSGGNHTSAMETTRISNSSGKPASPKCSITASAEGEAS